MTVTHYIGVGSGLSATPDYSSFATYGADRAADSTWTDDHELVGLWTSSANEITGSEVWWGDFPQSTFSLTIRPKTGESYKDHANKATNAVGYDAANGVCYRCTTTDAFMLRFGANMKNITIENWQFKFDSSANRSSGILLFGGPNITVRGNIIEQGSGGWSGSSGLSLSSSASGTNTFENNTVIMRGGLYGIVCEYNGGTVTNNINNNHVRQVTSNASSIGIAHTYGGSVTLSCYNNAVSGFNTDAGGTITGSHNATDKSSGSGLPATNRIDAFVPADNYVNASTNLRLKTGGSPSLIDAGTASYGPALDAFGNSRSGSATDIGSVEYASPATVVGNPLFGGSAAANPIRGFVS